jgi:5-methylcytosine-specific restriction endonuclease McrA
MKRCSKCGESKTLDAFSKRHDMKDGLQPKCKACTKAYLSQHYAKHKATYAEKSAAWNAANRDRQIAYRRAHYEANRARILTERSAYYSANAAKVIARVSAYAAANPDLVRARNLAYIKNNPEKIAARNAKSHARRIKAPGTYTADDVKALMALQRGLCAACRCSIRLRFEVDHVMPLARGGSNDRKNLQLLCRSCNRRKQAKHPIDFMQSKGFLL